MPSTTGADLAHLSYRPIEKVMGGRLVRHDDHGANARGSKHARNPTASIRCVRSETRE
jgi:hypothetical protein